MTGNGKKTGYWRNQVDEFCRIFGLKYSERMSGWGRRYNAVLMFGRAMVQVRSKKWSSGFDTFQVISENGETEEKTCEKMMRELSGNTIIWRWTEKPAASPLGFTRVRKERWVTLPEFGSVEELKFKLTASGVEL